MKSSRTLAVLGGAASLAVLAAMISPVATNAATPESRTPAAVTHLVTSVSTPSAHISAKKARAIVAHAVPKARFVSVKSTEHGGTATFAVKMERSDDSSVTGYVDEESGDIVDWAQTAAPVVAATAGAAVTRHRQRSPLLRATTTTATTTAATARTTMTAATARTTMRATTPARRDTTTERPTSSQVRGFAAIVWRSPHLNWAVTRSTAPSNCVRSALPVTLVHGRGTPGTGTGVAQRPYLFRGLFRCGESAMTIHTSALTGALRHRGWVVTAAG
jgi:uncharacterized membrane protein YkoI